MRPVQVYPMLQCRHLVGYFGNVATHYFIPPLTNHKQRVNSNFSAAYVPLSSQYRLCVINNCFCAILMPDYHYLTG